MESIGERDETDEDVALADIELWTVLDTTCPGWDRIHHGLVSGFLPRIGSSNHVRLLPLGSTQFPPESVHLRVGISGIPGPVHRPLLQQNLHLLSLVGSLRLTFTFTSSLTFSFMLISFERSV